MWNEQNIATIQAERLQYKKILLVLHITITVTTNITPSQILSISNYSFFLKSDHMSSTQSILYIVN